MKWLQYEFMNATKGSYNYNVGELVRQVRHYTANVAAEEFSDAAPMLKKMEAKLQEYDEELGGEGQNYIEEIMAELDTEAEQEELLLVEVTRLCKTIINYGSKREVPFTLDEYDYFYNSFEAVPWVDFNGYTDEIRSDDDELKIVKEVFRSVCYKYGVVFVDNTVPKPYMIPPDKG